MIKPPLTVYRPLPYTTGQLTIPKLNKPRKYTPRNRDLLEAQAAVDWAVSKLPSLQRRLDWWLKRNLDFGIEDQDSSSPNNFLIAITKNYFPLSFNAEFGAYINSIRTALDLLATVLAYRHSIPKPDKQYFPMASDVTDFNSKDFQKRKFVDGLPAPERKIIEDLKPYKGGNELLWLLHQFDIKRKHRNLLNFEVSPASFRITGWAKLIPLGTGYVNVGNKSLIALIAKDSADPNIQYTPHITINEGLFPGGQPAVELLYAFTGLATSIIKSFD